MVDSQLQDGVSRLAYPLFVLYFMIKNKLLYRVDQQRGEIIEQLLVPKPYASKMLYLAHAHQLGGQLGGRKKPHMVLLARSQEEYCRHCADCQLHSPKVTY